MGQPPRSDVRQIEFERGDLEQHQLKWIVLEHPDQTVLLEDDDYILDSYFNPQYDVWEVLIRLDPSTSEE